MGDPVLHQFTGLRLTLGKLSLKGKSIHLKGSSSREHNGFPEQFYHLVSVKQFLSECSCTRLTWCCKCFSAANGCTYSRGQITITKFAVIMTIKNFKTPYFCYQNSPRIRYNFLSMIFVKFSFCVIHQKTRIVLGIRRPTGLFHPGDRRELTGEGVPQTKKYSKTAS